MRFGLQFLFHWFAWASAALAGVFQQPTIRHPVAIALGAIAGSLSRYYLSLWFTQQVSDRFPWGTVFVNLTGCLAMGFFVTLILERILILSPEIRLLVMVGFLGSYTTFSTFGLDTVLLLQELGTHVAMVYWLGSAVLGVVGMQLGMFLARLLK